jgi:hypothetical protein
MILVYLIPVLRLYWNQINNFRLRKTTHERFGTPQYHQMITPEDTYADSEAT